MKQLKKIKYRIRKTGELYKLSKELYDFDYSSVLRLMKYQLEHLLIAIEKGYEVDNSRKPKEDDIRRVIELLDHKLKDDYMERCGYDFNYPILWKKAEGFDDDVYELETGETKEQKRNNKTAWKKGLKLEEDEWNMIFDIMKDKMRGWWD